MLPTKEMIMYRTPGSLGGGVIQTTASESTFVCLLAGRTEAIKRYQVYRIFMNLLKGLFGVYIRTFECP